MLVLSEQSLCCEFNFVDANSQFGVVGILQKELVFEVCVINMAQGVKLNRLAIMVGDFHESTTQAGVLSFPMYVSRKPLLTMNDILLEKTDS